MLTLLHRQYVFDTIPMFILTIIYCFIPPGRYVQMSFKQTKGENTVPLEEHPLEETA